MTLASTAKYKVELKGCEIKPCSPFIPAAGTGGFLIDLSIFQSIVVYNPTDMERPLSSH